MSVEEYEALFPRTETVLRPALSGEAEGASTVIDVSDGRGEFPLSPRPRSFASRAELIDHLARHLGVDEILRDEAGTPVAARGSYVLRGHTSWTDPNTDVRYAVADPILAYLGGVTGTVYIADELVCLDPDGACDGPRASYLVPEGRLTRPTHITITGNPPVTATFHSFFNKTPFPFPWARHGSNVAINVAPLPNTYMFSTGWIFFPTNPPPGLSSAQTPMETRTGEQSVNLRSGASSPRILREWIPS
ncbi:MAG: hypothetical protein OHK0013_11050 [Sandaracinaceae bacterium]